MFLISQQVSLQPLVGVIINSRKFCRFVHRFHIFIRCKFPGNLWIFGHFFAQVCSVDTELSYTNNRAKNQFNGFFTVAEVS